MVKTGMAKAGYIYVNIDDCWQVSRTQNGTIVADPQRFPSGIPALASFVHGLGLKLGIYSDAGYKTCAGRPGSLGYEKIDAATYAAWGIDYLKYDNCNTDGSIPEKRYPVMRDALNATGKPIFFSMCEWGVDNPATWAPSVGNSWRTTDDIRAEWTSVLANIDINNNWAAYAGPGGFNDPDMLEVGQDGLSLIESKSHFALWCLSKSPLIAGNDIRSVPPNVLQILTHPELIAINQDPLGVQARKVSIQNDLEVWAGPLADGDWAVLLLNRSPSSASITADWDSFGFSLTTTMSVRDVWNRQELGNFVGAFTANVGSHDSVVLRVTPTVV
eukprot:TRINITY_DN2914_c0_g1_i2.p1 TRINITY_DN2914_c0_g1~~TRINITY_DN2914_c0_g1_i2.p1  ORF type:complete len:330 (-),score=90.65 TRINITY_DN2914_c0_g1_i2:34-1023(-)